MDGRVQRVFFREVLESRVAVRLLRAQSQRPSHAGGVPARRIGRRSHPAYAVLQVGARGARHDVDGPSRDLQLQGPRLCSLVHARSSASAPRIGLGDARFCRVIFEIVLERSFINPGPDRPLVLAVWREVEHAISAQGDPDDGLAPSRIVVDVGHEPRRRGIALRHHVVRGDERRVQAAVPYQVSDAHDIVGHILHAQGAVQTFLRSIRGGRAKGKEITVMEHPSLHVLGERLVKHVQTLDAAHVPLDLRRPLPRFRRCR
mmetsp:Transcript_7672/g.30311  ORF Transcript_7672/g.30311 Transcript_7672/m.30311 type:complete len:260 (-) Transcript_7672:1057-1836(-)